MKRLLATFLTASLVLVLGCSKTYEDRLNRTLDRMKYIQRLDQYLQPPPQGKYRDLGIFLRPPKPLDQAPNLVGLTEIPGFYDLASSFVGVMSQGGDQAKKGQGGPPPALRLHVLARVKRPKKPAAKKGEPVEPPPSVNRGDFTTDVRTQLASDYGAGDTAVSGELKTETRRSNSFKRLIFTAPSNGDTIRVYFYKEGDYEAALVWDIPPNAPKPPIDTGIPLCLETFSVGPKALRAFAGGVGAEDAEAAGGPMIPGGGVPGGVPAQPF